MIDPAGWIVACSVAVSSAVWVASMAYVLVAQMT
jgi:hypothetical protein